jgi:hypothetical protein
MIENDYYPCMLNFTSVSMSTYYFYVIMCFKLGKNNGFILILRYV